MQSTTRTEEVIDLRIHHKVCAVLIILGACALLFQTIMYFTISDKLILDIAFEGAKIERDKTAPAPGMRVLTDEELKKNLEGKRAQIVSDVRKAISSSVRSIFGMIALFAIGFGILRKKQKYVRALAGIMTVLLILGIISFYKESSEYMSVFSRVKNTEMSMLMLADYAVLYFIPVVALACLVILIAPPRPEIVKHTQFYYDEPPQDNRDSVPGAEERGQRGTDTGKEPGGKGGG